MELPEFYKPRDCQGKDVVLKLNKSIYGQMDSPKLFYEHLCKGMNQLGFQNADSDPCLFIHKTEKIMVLNYCAQTMPKLKNMLANCKALVMI